MRALINPSKEVRNVVERLAKELCDERGISYADLDTDHSSIVAMRAHRHFSGNPTRQLMALKCCVTYQNTWHNLNKPNRDSAEINLESLL